MGSLSHKALSKKVYAFDNYNSISAITEMFSQNTELFGFDFILVESSDANDKEHIFWDKRNNRGHRDCFS